MIALKIGRSIVCPLERTPVCRIAPVSRQPAQELRCAQIPSGRLAIALPAQHRDYAQDSQVLCPKPGADGEPRSGKTRSLCGETLDPEPLSAAKQFASRVQLIEIGTLSANLTRMVFLAIRMHCG